MADSAHSTLTPANLPAPANLFRLSPLGCPAGIDPAAWRKAIADRIEALQDAQAALVAALDAMDGDCDFEPSLGAPEEHPRPWGWGYAVDPSHQLAWAGGTTDDEREEEHDGGEPDDDGEPSLGWSDHRNQAYIATEHGLDLEAVNEDGGNILDACHDIDFGGGTAVTEGGGSGAL